MLWSSDPPIDTSLLLGPTTLLWTLWQHAKQSYFLISDASLTIFLLLMPSIPESLISQVSHFWKERALFYFGQLVDARILHTFQNLQDTYSLPRQAFLSSFGPRCSKSQYASYIRKTSTRFFSTGMKLPTYSTPYTPLLTAIAGDAKRNQAHCTTSICPAHWSPSTGGWSTTLSFLFLDPGSLSFPIVFSESFQ